jgi:nicotinamidase-related amidase
MPSTALLVIDIQRGAFDGARCPQVDSPERLVQSATTLVDAAREGGQQIVFIQHCENETGSPFQDGTVHWQLHESLVPKPGDIVIGKRESSSFEGTDLQAKLSSLGVKDVVLCGLQSEFCVTNTADSALKLGYGVHVASDGHSTWPSDGRTPAQIEDEVNAKLAQAGAKVVATDGLARTLRTAA